MILVENFNLSIQDFEKS